MLNKSQINLLLSLRKSGYTWEEISKQFKGETPNALRKTYYRTIRKPLAKILLLDIETKPLIAHVWGLWENNVGLEQVQEDWSILSWSAKWLHDPDDVITYRDNRNNKDLEDDKKLLEDLWKMLDEADIVIAHNGDAFDIPKLYARFIKHGFKRPSSFKTIDTKKIAARVFKFSSNKLVYLADYLGVKYQKLSHAKFPGHIMWKECMKGNKDAWKEMEAYNRRDVLTLQEVYYKLRPWDSSINFNVYHDDEGHVCSCGSVDFKEHKTYHYTKTGKFRKYICVECGAESKGKDNLLSKEKRKHMRS